MKAIKILVEILEFNTALRDLIILGTDKAQARFNAMNKKVNEVEEALAELQALESYIEEQIVECQKIIDTKKADMFTYYEADGLRQSYTDILQKIRGEQ